MASSPATVHASPELPAQCIVTAGAGNKRKRQHSATKTHNRVQGRAVKPRHEASTPVSLPPTEGTADAVSATGAIGADGAADTKDTLEAGSDELVTAVAAFYAPRRNSNHYLRLTREDHAITVGEGTGCGHFVHLQCVTPSCPGYGHRGSSNCPLLADLPLFRGSFDDNVHSTIAALLERGIRVPT